jgi:hypothetical protein
VLTLVYSLASTIPGFAAQTGRTSKIFQEIARSSRCASLQSAACGGILSDARTRLFKIRLRLWSVITLYSYGTIFGIHNV